MSAALQIQKGETSLEFSSSEVEQLKACSGLISSELAFVEEDTSKNHLQVSSEAFDGQQMADCFAYLRVHDFKPPQYGKIVSSKLEDHFTHPFDLSLAQRYSATGLVFRLRSAAKYFQIPSVVALCNVMFGLSIWFDPADPASFKAVMDKFKIQGEYNLHVERELKARHSFLNH